MTAVGKPEADQGFSLSQFQVDWEAQKAVCPQGKSSRSWQPLRDRHGQPMIQVRFSQTDCKACPSRSLCTRGPRVGRTLGIRPQEQYEALRQARQRQKSSDFAKRYTARAGIEATIAQSLRVCGLRSCRYLGQKKAHLQNLLVATALNLVRVTAWLQGIPLAQTRCSPFARLAKQGGSPAALVTA